MAFGLFALAITPFILATPVYAIDDNDDNDNHVEITVSDTTQFERQGQLFKATANVTVKTVKPYGFNLTLQASNSDLTNTSDPTTKITSTPATTPMALNSDQWGYSLSPKATTFSRVPNLTQPAAVLADVTKAKPAGCQNVKQCTKHVTYAANVDTRLLTPGEYSTEVVYTATAKPKPAPKPKPIVEPTICKSGDSHNDCQVDIDANMIPVKYTGTTTNAQWTSLAKPEDNSNQGEWYNYNNKQWANAVTVKDPSKYKGKDMVVDQSDILGFWVYIPRYAYEVMRRDGTDKPVPAQNFLISFEKTTTPKRRPAACPEQGEDYREDCDLDRSYIKGKPSNQGTWATHPDFTFGAKELNGIWFGKFETTGEVDQPTVLPNSYYLSGMHKGMNGRIGSFYSVAKSFGVDDPQNVGGDKVSSPKNSHHLVKLSSHMVNNNDWGAATYLSASKYGAGYDGIQPNSNRQYHDGDEGITGCGPQYNDGHSDSGLLGTQQACGDPQDAYNGSIGRLASTTNNPTGIYDMFGVGEEYTAGSYVFTSFGETYRKVNHYGFDTIERKNYFGTEANIPYVNIYRSDTPDRCTFDTCGGQALYETLGWGGDADKLNSYQIWYFRGHPYHDTGSHTGVFAFVSFMGDAYSDSAFRVVLAPAPHD